MELLTINFETEQPTVSARELHNGLKIDTPFTMWFTRICEYGFEEGKDFITNMLESTGGRPSIDYQITVDTAKQICMVQKTEQGKICRQYLLDLEKAWNTPDQVMARALKLADKTIHGLKSQLLEQKPKVEFFDTVANSKTALPMDKVAKVLDMGIGRNKLFEILRDKKILDRSNIPYQTYVDRGYFRVVEQKYTKPTGETVVTTKTLVYQRGVDYIRKIVA